MDGQLFLTFLEEILGKEKIRPQVRDMPFDFRAFLFGDIGACEIARRLKLFRKEEEITTVADQREYNLPPDFISIARVDPDNMRDPVIKYTESGSTQYDLIRRRPLDQFWDYNTGQSADIPDAFDIKESVADPTAITGTVTAVGAESDGEAALTDSGATFTDGSDLVYPRYRVYNTTGKGTPSRTVPGVVVSVDSDTQLTTSIYLDGAAKGWVTGETYRIQKVGNFKLVFEYATATAGDTITVDYWAFPPPVFSKYRAWGFASEEFAWMIALYAAWLFKFRDTRRDVHGVNTEAMKSDKLYLMFERFLSEAKATRNRQKLAYWKPNRLKEIL